jgi:hypothetical protein
MPWKDKRPIELPRALGDMASAAAPRAPDFAAVYARDAARKAAGRARARRARLFLPLAAAASLAAGFLVLCDRPGPERPAEGLSSEYRLQGARDSAALAFGTAGAGGEDSSTGVEADLLGYIQALWEVPEQGSGNI